MIKLNLRYSLSALVVGVLVTGSTVSAQSRFTLFNGDVNGDFERDVSDGVYLLSHRFLGGPEPVSLERLGADEPSVENGDTNGDSAVDVSDAIRLLDWLYTGGLEPVRPYALAEGSGASASTSTTTTHAVDFSFSRANPCNGDMVSFVGRANFVTHTTLLTNGKFRLVFLSSWAGVEATGDPSGDTYRAINATRFVIEFDPGESPESNFTSRTRFVNVDGEGDVLLYVTSVIQVNANGETTAAIPAENREHFDTSSFSSTTLTQVNQTP